jgi:putative nucleotidyltransferase with HDIG domain
MSLLDDVVTKQRALMPLPAAARRAVSLIQDPDSTGAQVAHAIETDAALTARILLVANSALYASPRRVTNVGTAIVKIGFSMTRSILLSAAALRILESGRVLGSTDLRRLWRHSLACAFCAREIASILGWCSLEEAYTAGLLHDIGELALAQSLPDMQTKALRVAQGGTLMCEAERQVMGFSHAELGGRLLEQWGLAESAVQTVSFHHNPTALAGGGRLLPTVHVADSLSYLVAEATWPQVAWAPVEREAVESIGLNDKLAERVVQQAKRGLEGVESALSSSASARA